MNVAHTITFIEIAQKANRPTTLMCNRHSSAPHYVRMRAYDIYLYAFKVTRNAWAWLVLIGRSVL